MNATSVSLSQVVLEGRYVEDVLKSLDTFIDALARLFVAADCPSANIHSNLSFPRYRKSLEVPTKSDAASGV